MTRAKKKTKKTKKTASRAKANSAIDDLRKKIDQLDANLIGLLNDRAEIVQEIGQLKRGADVPVYSPDREYEVLQRISRLNKGPLPKHTLQAVYRELMSGSFALEKSLRIGYLGPEGTFSHLAAMRKFGASVDYEPLSDIEAIFEEVARKRCDLGIVPIENTLGGGVIDTLDCFSHFHGHVCAEVLLEIHHSLLANCPADKIKTIYSRPEAFAQCREWLSSRYRNADLVPVASSARAAQMVAKSRTAAALGSTLAAEVHGLRVLAEHVEDKPNNLTRFLVLSNTPAKRTGNDRTALMFTTRHKSGALVDALNVLAKHKVNLSSIDSRPTRRRNWAYYFFVEAEGHIADDRLAGAVDEIKTHCGELHVLGSFPRATEPV